MREKGKQWLTRKGLDKWFQRDNLVILVLSGILLFIIALPTKNAAVQEQEAKSGMGSQTGTETGSMGSSLSGQSREGETAESEVGADYAASLEQRLEDILRGIKGVGKVAVMITFVSTEELVVEKDEPLSRSDIRETDAAGGSRTTGQLETKETTVYITEGSNSEPYVVKKLLPRVEGVLVVAEGAGSGSISKSINEIVQALFGVEAHKIKVMKMEDTN